MADTVPTFEGLIRAICADVLDEVSTTKVGAVISYDHARNSATVQPLLRRGFYRDGVRQTERQAAVTNVPVMHFGSGAYRITVPIKKGDLVLLVTSDQSLDKWLQYGGELDPGDDRRHHRDDAFAIPGAFDFAHVPTDAPLDAMVLHGDLIRLGSTSASNRVATEDDFNGALKGILGDRTYLSALAVALVGLAAAPTTFPLATYQLALDAIFASKTFGVAGVRA